MEVNLRQFLLSSFKFIAVGLSNMLKSAMTSEKSDLNPIVALFRAGLKTWIYSKR